MKTSTTILLIVLTALAAALWLTGCQDKESMAVAEITSSEAPAIPVAVMVVEPVTLRDVIFLPGETEAYEDVKVAANTAGRVDWIGPREGQKVNKGDLLVKIDVSTLKASLDHARAAYQLADDLYQRRKRLFENKIIAREELDQSETQRTLALTDLEQIRERYNHGFPKSPVKSKLTFGCRSWMCAM
jgi:membrane fusion protein (multidrug efflux system)